MDLAAAGPTDEWVIRCSAKAVMAVLALAGITGIYLRQVRPRGSRATSSADGC